MALANVGGSNEHPRKLRREPLGPVFRFDGRWATMRSRCAWLPLALPLPLPRPPPPARETGGKGAISARNTEEARQLPHPPAKPLPPFRHGRAQSAVLPAVGRDRSCCLPLGAKEASSKCVATAWPNPRSPCKKNAVACARRFPNPRSPCIERVVACVRKCAQMAEPP
jgi:hypothetical protein